MAYRNFISCHTAKLKQRQRCERHQAKHGVQQI